MKKLWTIFISCTATACLNCTSPEDQPTNESLTQAPLAIRIVDLNPLVTEDLPLRVWGKNRNDSIMWAMGGRAFGGLEARGLWLSCNGGVSGNFVPLELERGLRFADSLGRAPVPVHFLLTVVKLSHVGVVSRARQSSVVHASIST